MITVSRLRELIDYHPDDGAFTWRVKASNRAPGVGEAAGGLTKVGYRTIGIDGRRYLAHRIAWLWMNGEWPKNEIDHINGDKSDNKWINLREATRSQNGMNKPARRDNKCGQKGVYFDKRRNAWCVEVCFNGNRLRKYGFSTLEEAAKFHAKIIYEVHGEFARHR